MIGEQAMKKEDLIKLGLTDEAVIEQIIILHGKDIEKHKTGLSTAQAESDGLKKQLTDANAAIEGFKKLDVEGIKKAADEWKTKAEQAQTEANKQIAGLKFDHALDGALSGAKAKNGKAVKALLDAELLKLADDGSISGLKEQLEKIKSENDYLFESETPTPKIVVGGNNKSVITDAVVLAARKAAGLPT
jgi:predicted  nucleic acid-binding Zn-ribbon protein